MKQVEASAKTREEAIQNALKELGVEMYEVDKIEVLDEGSKGLFGLGARPVRVRLIVESLHDEPRRDAESADSRPSRGGRGRGDRPAGERKDRGAQRETRNGKGPRAEKPAETRDDRPQRADRADRPEQAERGERGPKSERGDRGGRGRGRDRDRDRDSQPRADREGGRPRQEKAADPQGRRENRDAQRGNRPERRRGSRPDRDAAPVDGADVDIPASAEPAPDEQALIDNAAPITDEQGAEAAVALQEIITRMGIAATTAFVRSDDGSARVNVSSEDSAILIGRKGRNLNAMQYLINRMISRGDTSENTERIVVDVEGYVDRRRETLQEMALAMAAKAKDTQRNMRLKPLSPQERRIIHLALQDDEDIRTYSLGDSLFRSVVISPKNAVRPERPRGGRSGRGGRRRGGRGRSGDYNNRNGGQDIDVGAFGD